MRPGEFLRRAMSEGGEPSSSRIISVAGLLVVAPILLARVCPADQFGLAFEVWAAMCAGVYGVGRWSARGTNVKPPPGPTS